MSSKTKSISWDSPFNCLCIFFPRWRGWWVRRVAKRKKSPGSCRSSSYSRSHINKQLSEQLDSFVQIYFPFQTECHAESPKTMSAYFCDGQENCGMKLLIFIVWKYLPVQSHVCLSSRMCWVRLRLRGREPWPLSSRHIREGKVNDNCINSLRVFRSRPIF